MEPAGAARRQYWKNTHAAPSTSHRRAPPPTYRRAAGKKSPSTGLLAIALALGVCGRVSLYGFSRPSAQRRTCERHYWECPKWAEQYAYHDPAHACRLVEEAVPPA